MENIIGSIIVFILIGLWAIGTTIVAMAESKERRKKL